MQGKKIKVEFLSDYIERVHNGNKSAFAREFGFCRQNINGLIKRRAMMIDGEIYVPLSIHKAYNAKYQEAQRLANSTCPFCGKIGDNEAHKTSDCPGNKKPRKTRKKEPKNA